MGYESESHFLRHYLSLFGRFIWDLAIAFILSDGLLGAAKALLAGTWMLAVELQVNMFFINIFILLLRPGCLCEIRTLIIRIIILDQNMFWFGN